MIVHLYPPAAAAANPLAYLPPFVPLNAGAALTIPPISYNRNAAAACAPQFVGFIEMTKVPVG